VFRALLLSLVIALGAGIAAAPLQAEVIHHVRKGETVYSISRHYGVSPHLVLAANHLTAASRLRIGERLMIPEASAAIPAPAPAIVPPPAPTPALSASLPPPPPSLPPAPAPASTLSTSPSPPPSPNAPDETAAPHYLFIVGKVKQEIDSAQITPGRWRYIVFHHSGTPSGNARIFDYFHRYVRGMENGLAYHFVIGNGHGSGDGEIEVGGRWLKQLAGGHLHSEALNQISLGVCFVGDFDTTRPSKKQIAAAIELTSYLRQICGPPELIFKAHREINPRPTDCPGKLFPVAAFHKLFDND